MNEDFCRAPADRLSTATAAKTAKGELRRMGWDIEELNINQLTGWARLRVSRIDGDRKRLVTLMRSAHGGRVVERREVGRLRSGFCGSWWDFSESHLLGSAEREGWRSGLRMLARYIDDNPGPAALPGASVRSALRSIAVMGNEQGGIA